MKIRKGDQVYVFVGDKDTRGKKGLVIEVDRKTQRVKIEGVSPVKKHIAPNKHKKFPEGGCIMDYGMIHISNIKKIDEGSNVSS